MKNTTKAKLAGLLALGTLPFANFARAGDNKQVGGDPRPNPSIVQGVSVTSNALNNYTGTAYGMKFGDNPVVQTSLDMTFPKGFSSSVWSNADTGLNRQHLVNEVDYIVGTPLPKKQLGLPDRLNADATFIYLTFPHAGLHDAVTAQINLSDSEKKLPLSASIYKVWGIGSQQGYAAKASYNGSKEISKDTNLSWTVDLMANSHAFTHDTGLAVAAGTLNLTHKVNENLTFNAGLRHQRPFKSFNGTFETRTTGNLGATYKF